MSVSYDSLQLQRFDPEALLHVIDNTQMEHRLLGGGSLVAHWQRLALEDVIIMNGDYGFPVLVSGSMPQGTLTIAFILRPGAEERESYRVIQSNHLLLYPPGKETHYLTRSQASWVILAISPERLQETALALLGAPLDWPRRDLVHLDLQPSVAETLRQVLHGLVGFGQNLAQLTDGCLTHWLNSEGLLRLLVQAFASASPQARPSAPSPVVRKRCLTALESSIDRWLAQPIEALRVSQLVDVSERLLQLASRDVFGVTPQQWFRLARLNAAYAELHRGACPSVTTVCQHWGFEHMGRFAKDYRALFGESPRETLLRAQTGSPTDR